MGQAGHFHGVSGDQTRVSWYGRKMSVHRHQWCCWEDSHQGMAREAAAAVALQTSSKPHESPLPPTAFLVTAAPRRLPAFFWLSCSWSTSRSLLFSICLFQSLSLLVPSHGLEANQRPGQCRALTRGKPGVQLIPVPPRCPIAPCHHHQLLPSQLWHAGPGSRSSAGGMSRRRSVPSGLLSAHTARSIPQSKP